MTWFKWTSSAVMIEDQGEVNRSIDTSESPAPTSADCRIHHGSTANQVDIYSCCASPIPHLPAPEIALHLAATAFASQSVSDGRIILNISGSSKAHAIPSKA